MTNIQSKEHRNKVAECWYANSPCSPTHIRYGYYKVIEDYGFEILKKEGFFDIVKTSYQFPVDAFATDKDGELILKVSYLRGPKDNENS